MAACSSRSWRTSGFEFFGLRVRIERHAPVPGGPLSKDIFLRTTSPVKELPGPVPLQPLFKNTQVIRIGLHVLHQYLVRNGMCRSRRTVTVLLVVHGTENGGIGDLDLVEMQNGEPTAPVGGRVEEFVAVPHSAVGTSLRLSVSDNAND